MKEMMTKKELFALHAPVFLGHSRKLQGLGLLNFAT